MRPDSVMTPAPTVVYDANGNTLADSSGKQYTWDFENHLTSVTVPGTGTTTFAYDAFGRRIHKSGPLGTTDFLYDGRKLIEELDSGGNVLARYTGTESLDEPHNPAWREGVGHRLAAIPWNSHLHSTNCRT
jgi:YD repeat-containing protein